jgi:hypothetical protein
MADADERMVRMALVEIQEKGELDDMLVPTLVHRVVTGQRPPEIRVMGVRTLGVTGSTLARDALLDVVVAGKTFFGRPKLAEKSREVVVALSVLRSRWFRDSLVLPVLKVARRSKDPEIRDTVAGGGRG